MVQDITEKSGAPPGTLMYVGRASDVAPRITLIEYNDQEVIEKEFADINACFTQVEPGMVKWINIDGVHDVALVEQIGKLFNIHPLTLEDIVNTSQRPKFEDYENYIVCMMKMIYAPEGKVEQVQRGDDESFISEQLSILLLEGNTVISFQEAQSGDVFDIIRERIRQGKGRVRKCGADYLAYALIDAVVDSYFDVLEVIGDQVELLEEELIQNPQPSVLPRLHKMKRRMIFLRKAVWPMRELINNLERSETELIIDTTHVYLRDAHDHTIRLIDTVETNRDLLSGMMDLYMSSVSNRMNEVMKTLTIITTIFVPLTFIAGVYGMNFDNMPELHEKYGYFFILAVMLIIALVLLFFFRKRKWL
jgi:magnesium transporter